MNRNEMLKSLGLDDGLGSVKGTPSAPLKITPPTPKSVLKLDRWDIARGADLVKRSPEITSLGLPDPNITIADLHAVAFKPFPELLPEPSDPVRARFIASLLASGDCKALRIGTVLNCVAADIAAVQFARSYAELLKETAKSGDDKDEEETGAEEASDDSGAESDSEEASDGIDEAGIAAAARKAAAAASEEVEELEEVVAAFGYGEGGAGTPPSQKAIAELYRKVRNNPHLRRITELAGRFRQLAQAKQRGKVQNSVDETVGITLGDKVERLLVHELAKLTDPDLENDVLRRIVDHEAMIRDVSGKEKLGKGPIIVCVDESGSMTGDKVESAKAFALAMAWIARHQRRWCAMVAYTGGISPRTPGTHTRLPNGAGVRTLVLKPGQRNDDALVSWLSEFMSEGSNIDIPIREMANIYKELKAPQGVTDVFFITDAICNPPQVVVDGFNAWKKSAKARLTTLLITGGYPSDQWKECAARFSDEIHLADRMLETSNAGVEKCLSI